MLRKLVLLSIVGVIGFWVATHHHDEPVAKTGRLIIPPQPPALTDKFTIVKDVWTREGFGTIAAATLLFSNQHEFAVRDPVVKCTFYGQSGTPISDKTLTVYRVFQPKQSTSARDLDFGFIDRQVQSVACGVLTVSRD